MEPQWPQQDRTWERRPGFSHQKLDMDLFKGIFTSENPHIYWENLGFPVDFPLNQSVEKLLGPWSFLQTMQQVFETKVSWQGFVVP